MPKKKDIEQITNIEDIQVSDIVNKMNKKYKRPSNPQEQSKFRIETPLHVKEGKSKFALLMEAIYERFSFLKKITKNLSTTSGTKLLEKELESANMLYTPTQYLGVVTTAAIIIAALAIIIGSLVLKFVGQNILGGLLLGIIIFLISFGFGLLIPNYLAQKRGSEIDRVLPFALRHMATEIHAGVSLVKTFKVIADSNYGVLSEEFGKTIKEIEGGASTEDALENMASRVKSEALRSALVHTLRSLRTGGKLSDIIVDIAEDVAFEARLRIKEFAEKMNFMGVLFVVFGIVLPVLTAILGAIRNTPVGAGGSIFSVIPLTPVVIVALFWGVFPLLLLLMVFIVKASEPVA